MDKSDVVPPNVGHVGEHLSTADDFHLKTHPIPPLLQDGIDQQFHSVVAVACRSTQVARLPTIVCPLMHWEHEMIHAANTTQRVADTAEATEPNTVTILSSSVVT